MIGRQEPSALRARADRNVEAARHVASGGFPEVALSRSYYAMFYAACALLAHHGLAAKTHAGVRTMLAQRFLKTDLMSREAFRWYCDAFDYRLLADYEGGLSPDEVQIGAFITNAAAFIAEVRRVLSLPGD